VPNLNNLYCPQTRLHYSVPGNDINENVCYPLMQLLAHSLPRQSSCDQLHHPRFNEDRRVKLVAWLDHSFENRAFLELASAGQSTRALQRAV
jgi:hypothetical protein